MKTVVIVAVLLIAGWLGWNWMQSKATPDKIRQSAPVRYTSSLQNDVKKAEDVQQKANAAIKQGEQDAQKTLQEAEGK